MARNVPMINTARLTMRGMRSEDFKAYAEIWANPEVVKYIGGEPCSRAKAWDAFLRLAGHWQIVGFGQWAVEIHRQPEISGQVGFFYASRGLGEDFDAYPEAGWVLHPAAHGQGLAKEATVAAHDWFDRIITGPSVCLISPENTPSLRLAKSLGYRSMRDAEYDGETVLLMMRKHPPA